MSYYHQDQEQMAFANQIEDYAIAYEMYSEEGEPCEHVALYYLLLWERR